jgi:tetratricopeptide (TPR) repeat protein
MSVIARIEPLVIPTYPVGVPEKNPVFFERRVYQGSNGKVYPVPFIDKVHDHPRDVTYQSARLENDCVRLVMLPEIGGRIFLGQDKTNSDYDFFYRQDVIKPALVGLAGPWVSGGVEFNWPQHHRPGTFMPTDVFIEDEEDGAKTIWMSENDPLNRLKGMHGVRLRPGSSLVELRVRLYNRTPFTQTFLWWANVAAMVHDFYQSFFPPDVDYVADHAVRAMSSFPIARNSYYGVDYANRAGADDLSWYRNIPVPTSYMVCQTQFDFFGGYDFNAGGGFLHVANRHIAPGKKQWTWGDHAFGHAWDRELTDHNGPYIELMAGVYTDNQPDFSYMTPYETKTFSQFWWPIKGIGTVQQANERIALRMIVANDRKIELAVCVSQAVKGGVIRIHQGENMVLESTLNIQPGDCWKHSGLRFTGENISELSAVIQDEQGELMLTYRPKDIMSEARAREVATEPPSATNIRSADELYWTGEHLELYRHPTRSPEIYWLEALSRDPGDARCNIAMGRRALKRGLWDDAANHFQKAISRLTSRHPNPETGEAHYFLGLTRFFQERAVEAYTLLYKATWNHAWSSSAYYLVACLDCRKRDYSSALLHLDRSLANNRDHTKAMVLQALIARHFSEQDKAGKILENVLTLDPLDPFATIAAAFQKDGDFHIPDLTRNDAQTVLDVAFDFVDAGFLHEALALLDAHHKTPVAKIAVPNPLERSAMTRYLKAWITRDASDLELARKQSPDYFFPSRPHEQLVLEWALSQEVHDTNSSPACDSLACYGLGNYYYDLKRHDDAIGVWQRAVDAGALFSTVHRNLGIAMWNVKRDGELARACYLKAIHLDSADSRLVSEYDQLRCKLNDPLMDRIDFLEQRIERVMSRDDCSVGLATLYNLTGRPDKALDLLASRRFHPWEGGEGSVLRQFTNAHLHLGRMALSNGDGKTALCHFKAALDTPENLGEAYHLLQAKADVNHWLGRAYQLLGMSAEAQEHYLLSSNESGDFTEMAVTVHGPMTYYRGLSMRELGNEEVAMQIFEQLRCHAVEKLGETANIDYFATSLPNILVFEEDLQARRNAENHLLIALACHGLRRDDEAREHLGKMFAFTNSDPWALDLAESMN